MSSNRDGPTSGISTRKRARDTTTSGGYYTNTFLNPALLSGGEVRTRYQARLFTLDAALDQITTQRQHYANYIQSFTGNTNTSTTTITGGSSSSSSSSASSPTVVHSSAVPIVLHTNNSSNHIVGYDTEQSRSFVLTQAIHSRRLRRRLLHSIESITPANINLAKDLRDNRSATTAERRHLLNRQTSTLKEHFDKLSGALPSTIMMNAILTKLESRACTLSELFTFVAQSISNSSVSSSTDTTVQQDRSSTSDNTAKYTTVSPLRSKMIPSEIPSTTGTNGNNVSFESLFPSSTSTTTTNSVQQFTESYKFCSRVLELCSSLQNTNILRIVQQNIPLSASTLLGLSSIDTATTMIDDTNSEEINCETIMGMLQSSLSSNPIFLSRIILSLNLSEYSHFASTIGRTLTTEPARWQNIQNFQNTTSSSSTNTTNNLSKSPDKSKRRRNGTASLTTPSHTLPSTHSTTNTPYASPSHGSVTTNEPPDSPVTLLATGETKTVPSNVSSFPGSSGNQMNGSTYNLDNDTGLLTSLITPAVPFPNLDILTTSLSLNNPTGKKQKSTKDKESREVLSQIYGVGDSTALLSLLPTNIRTNGYSGSLYDAGSLITPTMAVLVPPTRLPYESTDKFIIENAVNIQSAIREQKPENIHEDTTGTGKRSNDQPLQFASRVQSLLETTGYRRRRPMTGSASSASTSSTTVTVTDTNLNQGGSTTDLNPIPETDENDPNIHVDIDLPVVFDQKVSEENSGIVSATVKEVIPTGLNDKTENVKVESSTINEGSVVPTVTASSIPVNSSSTVPEGDKSSSRSVSIRNEMEQSRLASATANTISRYGYSPSTNPLFPPVPPNRVRLNDPTGRSIYLTIDKVPTASSSSSLSASTLLYPFLQSQGKSEPLSSHGSTFSAIPSVVVPTAVTTGDDPTNLARMPLIPLPSYGLPTYTSFQDPTSEAVRLIKGTLGDYWQVLPHVRRGADNGPLDDVSLRYSFPSTSSFANGSALAGPYLVRESLYTSPTAPIDGIPVQTSYEYDWSKEIAPLFGPPPSAIVDEDGDFVIDNPDPDTVTNSNRRNSNRTSTTTVSIVDEEAFEWDSKYKKRKRGTVTEAMQTPVRSGSEGNENGVSSEIEQGSEERSKTENSSSPLLVSTTAQEIQLMNITVDAGMGESQSIPAKVLLQPYREGAPQIAVATDVAMDLSNNNASTVDVSSASKTLRPTIKPLSSPNSFLSPTISLNDLLAPPYTDLGDSMVSGMHESRQNIIQELQLEPVRTFMSRTLDENCTETVTVPSLVPNPSDTTIVATVTYNPSIATLDSGLWYRPLSNWDRWETVKIERKLQYERERQLERENLLRNNSSSSINSATVVESLTNDNASSSASVVTAGTGITQQHSISSAVTVPVSPRLPRLSSSSPNIRRITTLQNEVGTIDSDEDLEDSVYERLHIIKNAYIERRFDERQRAVHKEELARKEREKDNPKLPRPPPKARTLLPGGNGNSGNKSSPVQRNSYYKLPNSASSGNLDTSPTVTSAVELPPSVATAGSNSIIMSTQSTMDSTNVFSAQSFTSALVSSDPQGVLPNTVTIEAPYGKVTGPSTVESVSSETVVNSPSLQTIKESPTDTTARKLVSRSGRKVIPKTID